MRSPVFFAVLALALSHGTGCASLRQGNTRVTLDQDATIAASPAPKAVRKGEAFELGDEPALIEAPGFMSVLVVPTNARAQSLEVRMRAVDSWGGDNLERKINATLNEVVNGITDSQVLIGSGKAGAALARLDELHQKYPNVNAIQVLRASCLIVLGDRAQALAILEKSIREQPGNPAIVEVYESLRAGNLDRAAASIREMKGRRR